MPDTVATFDSVTHYGKGHVLPRHIRDAARRHTLAVALLVGGALGGAGGLAYASSQHTYNGWNHGFDEGGVGHVYMTRTTSATDEGVVAYIVSPTHWSCGGFHGPEVRYTANHVHTDGFESGCQITTGGHISSPSPYLSHHEHN